MEFYVSLSAFTLLVWTILAALVFLSVYQLKARLPNFKQFHTVTGTLLALSSVSLLYNFKFISSAVVVLSGLLIVTGILLYSPSHFNLNYKFKKAVKQVHKFAGFACWLLAIIWVHLQVLQVDEKRTFEVLCWTMYVMFFGIAYHAFKGKKPNVTTKESKDKQQCVSRLIAFL
eukprot:TRINITY_DN1907_c0_g1_i1.p2 TRINITY_DN1907_c0_g1~~TRINITY_DN1907_c0_g1_i1.p2  ORF type:complete len:173 (-),score=11.08 TRINITY_DN1907_c0_g1_i1:50-568(-)